MFLPVYSAHPVFFGASRRPKSAQNPTPYSPKELYSFGSEQMISIQTLQPSELNTVLQLLFPELAPEKNYPEDLNATQDFLKLLSTKKPRGFTLRKEFIEGLKKTGLTTQTRMTFASAKQRCQALIYAYFKASHTQSKATSLGEAVLEHFNEVVMALVR
jgi:hypothetical protein